MIAWRRAIETVAPAFSARRMLKEYADRFYGEAAGPAPGRGAIPPGEPRRPSPTSTVR
jgi:hypothetical protein